ncbi:MAG: FGGY-family carbohydrate kinase [Planctomycetaceae bacterium]|nr:FGGY-family carbohydrate kinase [Planctomycetaceae bacterium]
MSMPSEKTEYYIGIDLGATHVVAIAITQHGEIVFESRCDYNKQKIVANKERLEQAPEEWWSCTCYALGYLMSQLRDNGIAPTQLQGVSVSGPTNDIAVIDRAGHVLHPAILGDDPRAVDQVIKLNSIGFEHVRKLGTPFRLEDAIAKIVWIKDNLPDIYENGIFAHPSDYVLGMLKGTVNVTDASVSITTGHDPIDNCWPDWLDYDMHLSVRERLPQLGELGQVAGEVTRKASEATGLPIGLPVVLGCSSQTASFIASGARQKGDFFTVFGERMSVSGISQRMLRYPHNIVKMNRLPGCEWFFSTRSNTGTEWINVWFSEQQAKEYLASIESMLPSKYMAYPNVKRGETFPFTTNSAEGFISPATDNRPVQFAACVQGTAMLDRLIYQTIDQLGENQTPGHIYTIGPWCFSEVWMQCRSDMCERMIHRLANSQGPAFGAAMIAAIGTKYGTIQLASDAMVRIEKTFFPNPNKMGVYKECFMNFMNTIEEQGYLV